MSLDAVLTQIATVQATIPGVLRAYDQAPASLKECPAFINWGDRGGLDRVTNMQITKHHVKMQLFVMKAQQEMAETVLRPFLDSTLLVFNRNLTLNGSCVNCMITNYEYGVMTYGGEQFLGISFDLTVIEWLTFNFSAAPTWQVALSVSDPTVSYTDDALASDNDTATYAYTTIGVSSWGNYLYFNAPTAGFYASAIKYWVSSANVIGPTGIDQVQVDVYKDGAWVSLYNGTITGQINAWITQTFTLGLVTQARVRAHNNSATLQRVFEIMEFQFYG